MLDSLRQQHGEGSFLFLGRSVSWVQLAYEELNKVRRPDSTEKSIYHLNFSGTPDVEYHRDELTDALPSTIARHMVTPERLSFICDDMDRQGMRNITNKIYLVDTIGTGRSLNSILRLLRYYYTVHLQREMPEVNFLVLEPLLLSQKSDPESNPDWTYDPLREVITFNDSTVHNGIRPLGIRTFPVYVNPLTVGVIDNDFFEAVGVHGIEYPPNKWRSEFDNEVARGGKAHKLVYDDLRPYFGKVIAGLENQIKLQSAKK